MVRASLKKSRYVFALVLTILIFSLGVLIGTALTNSRVSFTQDLTEQQRLEYDSLQLQYLYLTEFLADENCPAVMNTLDQNLKNLDTIRVKLENYLEKDDETKLRAVKREYILSELRYWFLSRSAKKICGENDVVSVLYFYSSEGCEQCANQGAVLTSLKETFKSNLLIFSIDSLFEEEPMVSVLKDSFGITETPTLVVNDELIKGFTKKEELKEKICSKYKDPIDACK
ncbi:MAG: thioredoxin family protein [Candidatus Woesearchaeota archaeon]